MVWPSFPSLNSLIAAYLWLPLCPCSPITAQTAVTKGEAELCLPLSIQHRHGFVSVSFIIKR